MSEVRRNQEGNHLARRSHLPYIICHFSFVIWEDQPQIHTDKRRSEIKES
jgi:hypothetical protein